MLFVRFYCIYWRYPCTVMQVADLYTVKLLKIFLVAELVCFFRHVTHSKDSSGYC